MKKNASLNPWLSMPGPAVFHEALVIFILSATLGVLFNLLYDGGIELKVRPKKPAASGAGAVSQTSVAPVTYSGWNTRPATAKEPFSRISLSGAKRLFDASSAVFLDARPVERYVEGHITGALNLDVNQSDPFTAKVLLDLPRDREIVTYCSGGNCDDSIVLAKKMSEMGFSKVKVFEVGFPAWHKAGYPASTGEQP